MLSPPYAGSFMDSRSRRRRVSPDRYDGYGVVLGVAICLAIGLLAANVWIPAIGRGSASQASHRPSGDESQTIGAPDSAAPRSGRPKTRAITRNEDS
jgi:hypothetical protein